MTKVMIVIHLRYLLPSIFSTLPEDNASSSYLTISPLPIETGGLFSAALSVASLRLAVN